MTFGTPEIKSPGDEERQVEVFVRYWALLLPDRWFPL